MHPHNPAPSSTHRFFGLSEAFNCFAWNWLFSSSLLCQMNGSMVSIESSTVSMHRKCWTQGWYLSWLRHRFSSALACGAEAWANQKDQRIMSWQHEVCWYVGQKMDNRRVGCRSPSKTWDIPTLIELVTRKDPFQGQLVRSCANFSYNSEPSNKAIQHASGFWVQSAHVSGLIWTLGQVLEGGRRGRAFVLMLHSHWHLLPFSRGARECPELLLYSCFLLLLCCECGFWMTSKLKIAEKLTFIGPY